MKKPSKKKHSKSVKKARSANVLKGCVLLLSPEKPLRKLVSTMLYAEGYQCRVADGGVDALAFLNTAKAVDLILTDLVNDRLGGIGLLELKNEKFADIPLALMTTPRRLGYALEGIRNGAYDFLLVPFERERLCFFVQRALEHRRLTLENRIFRQRLGVLDIPKARDRKHILVQDDEEPIREIIGSMLSTSRYECHEAETAQDTLDTLGAHPEIDVVLCGIIEWTEEQFRHMLSAFPNVPVVVASGAYDLAVPVLRKGAYDFLPKPFEREQLLFLVQRALEYRNLKLEHEQYSLLT